MSTPPVVIKKAVFMNIMHFAFITYDKLIKVDISYIN